MRQFMTPDTRQPGHRPSPAGKHSLAGSKKPRYAWRHLKDLLARYGIAAGGISVIVTIVLIFFYLLYEVIPLFTPSSTEFEARYNLAGHSKDVTALLYIEEQAEIALRVSRNGKITFFDSRTGKIIKESGVDLPADTVITGIGKSDPEQRLVAFGLSDGRAIIVRHDYQVTYPEDRRQINPKINYPLGKDPVLVDEQGRPLIKLGVETGDDETTLVALTDDGRLIVQGLSRAESLMDDEDEVELEQTGSQIATGVNPSAWLRLDKSQRTLYVIQPGGELSAYDVQDKSDTLLVQKLKLNEPDEHITAVEFLTGGISILVGTNKGRISQWFPVRGKDNAAHLTKIRSFDSHSAAVLAIEPEQQRKGFAAAYADGYFGLFYTTSDRRILMQKVSPTSVKALAMAPRANALLLEDAGGELQLYKVDNEHPEISWDSIWGEVWYESYPEPDYIWQSSSADNDFEPKLSLVPLAFGTLKAAFYAMLFAMPLAIMGAVYTAYFMAPRMRNVVKPAIEIMEALPTVILGFLAGLWLAPLIERNLPGVFSMLLILPVGVIIFAWLWGQLPAKIRHCLPEGWQALLLLPVIVLLVWGSLAMSPLLEHWFFGGNMPVWLTSNLGLNFDQRNSIVVGVAMGFAVIPTIFSIAEDAIFSVPKQLTYGSLALGATPWQTMMRVVLLTASPGIFSAVMMGMGRAVGETMIVLMATGNTPIMDMNIFEGMRTLSANIAVEMPEAEVSSTHYRVLFLAAMVLFLFTFIFNTFAELIRQRLRRKYSSL